MFKRKRLPFSCVFFILFLGCASGTVKDTGGPSVSEAQAVSPVGPKARIAVARFKNLSKGPEMQVAVGKHLQVWRGGANAVDLIEYQKKQMEAMNEYYEKQMNYQAELMLYEARLKEVGSKKAGPPPKAPKPPKMNSSPYMSFGSDPVAIGFHDMMIIALFNSKRFIVLERENIEKLNWEQELGQSTGSGNETGLPTGQIEGAELLLTGSIDKLEGNTSGGRLAGDFLSSIYNAIVSNKSKYLDNELRNTDFSWKSAKAYMHLRLIDTRTSRVVAVTTVEGKSTGMRLEASKSKYKYAGNLPSSFSAFQNTPVEDAFRKMIDAAVEFLLTKTPENYYHHQE